MKVSCFYLLSYCLLAFSQQRLTFAAPSAPQSGDVKATIVACGKPTRQRPISGGDEDAPNSWILYYQRQGVDLVYNKVNGQWQWDFADDHRDTGMYNKWQLLNRMPCMEKIVVASNARAKAASATAPASTPAGATPAGSFRSETSGSSGS